MDGLGEGMSVDVAKIQERKSECERDLIALSLILFRTSEQEYRHQNLIEELHSLKLAQERYNWR